MNLLHTIVAFLVALGVLVAFHEFGHYLAARMCGVKVLRFCLGFGSPIISRRWGRDQTEWAIAAFPLGGYVKLLGQDPEEVVPPEEFARSFSAQSVGKRMWIVVAGPLANLLLAVGLYWGLNLYGIDEAVARIAAPAAESPAARAQLRGGDTVIAVDGQAVRAWGDLSWHLLQAAHDRRDVTLAVRRGAGASPAGPTSPPGVAAASVAVTGVAAADGAVADRTGSGQALVTLALSSLTEADVDGDTVGKLGLRPYRPNPRVTATEVGSPSERGGLLSGDVLVKVDGRSLAGSGDFVRDMRANPGRELAIEALRAGTVVTLKVTPARVEKDGQTFGRIGAALDDAPALVRVRYDPVEALVKGVRHTWEMSVFSVKMLGRMVIGEVSWRNLSGPVTIADYAGKTARLGATYYLNFIALVSISLGVLNLLPIPVLDGGYLLYYSLEAIRKKPVPPSWMEWGAKFGLVVVAIAMSLALFNDISRLVAG